MLRRNLILAIVFAASAAAQDTPPSIGLTSSPAAGSGNGMFSFQAVTSGDLNFMYMMFELPSNQQCSFYYYPGSNTLTLMDQWGQNGVASGYPGTLLSNNQCRIETDSNWDGSSTLNVHVTFLAGLQGLTEIWMDAYDDVTGLESGYGDFGSWDTRSPLISSFTPASGAPGSVVTIVGSDFGLSPGTVSFNGAAAATIWSWTNTQIVATVPSGASTGPIVVTNASGIAGGPSSAFGVAPVILSFSPTSGPPGTVVAVAGSHFSPTPYTVTLWNNGTVSNDPTNAQCDGTCADMYHPTTYIFDSFTVPPGGMTISGFDYYDFFSLGVYVGTPWSIWSGDPLNGGTLVASGNSRGSVGNCNVVATGTCIAQITVGNLSVTLPSGGTYWLGTSTPSYYYPSRRALASGNGQGGYEQSNGSTTGVVGSTWQSGSSNVTYTGAHTAFDIFGTRNVVTFGGVPAMTTSWTDTQILATVPSNGKTGPVAVTANGMTATTNSSFTVIGGDPDPDNPLTSATNIGVFRATPSNPAGMWYLDLLGMHTWDLASLEMFNFGMYDTTTKIADQPVVGQWVAGNPLSAGIFRSGYWLLDWNNERGWDPGYDGSNAAHPEWHVINFGMDGDTPVIGDWKQESKLRIGVVRSGPSSFDWHLQTGCPEGGLVCDFDINATATVLWGMAGDIPVIGDWDNKGTLRIGVFRPNTTSDPHAGKWIVNLKTCAGANDVNAVINCNSWNFNDNTDYCNQPGHTCDCATVPTSGATPTANCWAVFSTPPAADNSVIVPNKNTEFVGNGGFGTFSGGTWHQQVSYKDSSATTLGTAFGAPGDIPVMGPWADKDFTLTGSCPTVTVGVAHMQYQRDGRPADEEWVYWNC